MDLWSKLIAGGIVCAIMLYALLSRRHRPYIGYGWKLGWRDGQVIVLSRLLESPSGRAGVNIGSVLRSYDGKAMHFDSADEFESFMDNRPEPVVGELGTFCLMNGKRRTVIRMCAETIRSEIPYYPPLPPLSAWGRMCTKESVFICKATGQWVVTRRLGGFGYDLMTK